MANLALGGEQEQVAGPTTDRLAQRYHVSAAARLYGPTGGTVSSTATDLPAGSAVTLTATPDDGYRFVRWDGDASGTQNPLTLRPDAHIFVTAVFEPVVSEYRVRADASPAAGGDVRGLGNGVFEQGEEAILTALPSDGYRFVRWGGDASGTDNPLVFFVARDVSVTAEFQPLDEQEEEDLRIHDPSCSVDDIGVLGLTYYDAGSLPDGRCRDRINGGYAKIYRFRVEEPTELTIEQDADGFYPLFYLIDTSNTLHAEAEGLLSGSIARTTATLTAGSYDLVVTTQDTNENGSYELDLFAGAAKSPLVRPGELSETESAVADTGRVTLFTSRTLPDQNWQIGQAVNLALPAATGGSGFYTYSIKYERNGDQSWTPAGVAFDRNRRVFSGVPIWELASNLTSRRFTVFLRADDRLLSGQWDELEFVVNVLEPPAPAQPHRPTLPVEQCSTTDLGTLPQGVPTHRHARLRHGDCGDPFSDRGDYADLFSFDIARSLKVRIELASDDIVGLLRLLDERGRQIAADSGSRLGDNALIVRSLPAGSYQLVASEAMGGQQTGAYGIAITVLTAERPQTPSTAQEEPKLKVDDAMKYQFLLSNNKPIEVKVKARYHDADNKIELRLISSAEVLGRKELQARYVKRSLLADGDWVETTCFVLPNGNCVSPVVRLTNDGHYEFAVRSATLQSRTSLPDARFNQGDFERDRNVFHNWKETGSVDVPPLKNGDVVYRVGGEAANLTLFRAYVQNNILDFELQRQLKNGEFAIAYREYEMALERFESVPQSDALIITFGIVLKWSPKLASAARGHHIDLKSLEIAVDAAEIMLIVFEKWGYDHLDEVAGSDRESPSAWERRLAQCEDVWQQVLNDAAHLYVISDAVKVWKEIADRAKARGGIYSAKDASTIQGIYNSVITDARRGVFSRIQEGTNIGMLRNLLRMGDEVRKVVPGSRILLDRWSRASEMLGNHCG